MGSRTGQFRAAGGVGGPLVRGHKNRCKMAK
jgi:hypothetical protein